MYNYVDLIHTVPVLSKCSVYRDRMELGYVLAVRAVNCGLLVVTVYNSVAISSAVVVGREREKNNDIYLAFDQSSMV